MHTGEQIRAIYRDNAPGTAAAAQTRAEQ